MAYKFLSHTADIKIEASGKSIEEAFSESALALKETILKHESIKIKEKIKKIINVEGKDNGALLYNFLEEFLYLLDAEDFLLSKINKIEIYNGKLGAEIMGDKASNYKISNEVKAITYNEMKIEKKKSKTIIQFILDV